MFWDFLTLAVSRTLGAEPKGSEVQRETEIEVRRSRISWKKRKNINGFLFVFFKKPTTEYEGPPLNPCLVAGTLEVIQHCAWLCDLGGPTVLSSDLGFLIGCVSLGKISKFSKPQCPHLQNGHLESTYFI